MEDLILYFNLIIADIVFDFKLSSLTIHMRLNFTTEGVLGLFR